MADSERVVSGSVTLWPRNHFLSFPPLLSSRGLDKTDYLLLWELGMFFAEICQKTKLKEGRKGDEICWQYSKISRSISPIASFGKTRLLLRRVNDDRCRPLSLWQRWHGRWRQGEGGRLRRSVPLIWRKNSCHLPLLLLLLLFLRHRRRSKRPRGDGKRRRGSDMLARPRDGGSETAATFMDNSTHRPPLPFPSSIIN